MSDARLVSLWLLVAGFGFQGLSGLYGGGTLAWDPAGALLQMSPSLLEGAPFSTYRVPGLILFAVLGIGPLVVAVGLWRRRAWAWYGAVVVSGALIIWIAVEIWMIGYHPQPPLQLIYGTLGVVLLVLTLRPGVSFGAGGMAGGSVYGNNYGWAGAGVPNWYTTRSMCPRP